MQLNIKRIRDNDQIVIYNMKEHLEICGISSQYFFYFSSLYQLRRIAAVNSITTDMYELRQSNIFLKILCDIFFIFRDPVMCPRYKFYINDVHYGKLTRPFAVIDQCEYKFSKFSGFDKDEYDFTFHRPNVIAVLKNGIQVAKMLFHDKKFGGDYTVYYNEKEFGDIMLLFVLTIAMDNAIFPVDVNHAFFGYPKENYPERIEWMPEE